MAARGRRSSQLPVAFIVSGKTQFILLFLHVRTLGSFSVLALIAFLTHVDKTLFPILIPILCS